MFTDAYWPRVNGVTVSVDSFSLALVKAGHEVTIVCSQYPVDSMTDTIGQTRNGQEDPIRKQLKLLRVPSRPVFFSGEDRAAKLSCRRWMEKELDAFAPDIVHVNSEFIIGTFGFRYAKKRRLPAVYTFHTIWEDYIANYFPHVPDFLLRSFVRWYIRRLLKRSTLIIVPTVQIEEMVKSYKIKKETRILPTGIDPDLFRHDAQAVEGFRRQMEEKYPVVRGKRLLLFAGRVAKEKNLGFVIEMFPELLAKHPDLVLLIAGNGPGLDGYREEAKNCGVADSCVFPGYLSREELSLVYAISHIFVLPSVTETQGLVTIEAMLSGTPVVAIGAMGTLQVMGGDHGGFMVQNDRDEFKKRVLQLLEDDDLYRNKVEEARLHAQQWTIGSLTERLVEIYNATIFICR